MERRAKRTRAEVTRVKISLGVEGAFTPFVTSTFRDQIEGGPK
jgi:hypothetical protein